MCCDSWGCKELDITEQLNWSPTGIPMSPAIWNHELVFYCHGFSYSGLFIKNEACTMQSFVSNYFHVI